MLFLRILEEKSFVWQQDLGSKETLFLIHFVVQRKLSLKPVFKKDKNVTQGEGRGGGRRSAKKVSRIIWMAINKRTLKSK